MWHEHHEMSTAEIARKLRVTEDSVKHTLKSAMKKLKDGRAKKMKELAVAREKEKNYGLPRIVKERE